MREPWQNKIGALRWTDFPDIMILKQNIRIAEKRISKKQAGIFVESLDLDQKKKQFRKRMLNEQKRLPDEYITQASRIIQEKVLSLKQYQSAKSIFLYVSTDREPSTLRILTHALQSGKAVYVPKCISCQEMLAVRIRSLAELAPGAWGIPEPRLWTEEIKADALDLILVPCVSASLDGKRLGHGAGYYDRFLTKKTDRAVCLCFHRLVSDDIPITDNDVIIPLVLTEEEREKSAGRTEGRLA